MSKIYFNKHSENKIYYYVIKNFAGKIQWRSTHCKKKSEPLSFLKDKPVEPARVMHTHSSFYQLSLSLKSAKKKNDRDARFSAEVFSCCCR
jgi:hypothetical protein